MGLSRGVGVNKKKLEYWKELFDDAKSKKASLDTKIKRREDLYSGKAKVIDRKSGNESSKQAYTFRNMCFELIETQINNAIPQPKVTPRDSINNGLAADIEGYLTMEMDRLDSETMNDESERGVYKQGTGVYHVYWDETESTPLTRGEVGVKYYNIGSIYPQPGVHNVDDLEYIFTVDLVSVAKIKELYGVEVPEGTFKGIAELVTAWYYDKKGGVSKFGFIPKDSIVVFDQEDYEIRQILACDNCGYAYHEEEMCPVCGETKKVWVTKETEPAPDDVIKGDASAPEDAITLAKKGDPLPYYRINKLPFIFRRNISQENSIWGVSDIDILEENQISMNKILTKLEENVLKAGSIVTVPVGVNIPNNDETLKIVKVKDPKMMAAFDVKTIQANMQQDNILQEQFYQMGRDSLGITDSYQGKRDTTAESGKAKQVAAAQASGRLESKRRMKDAAYAELYELIFKFLLAYSDEPRTFTRVTPDGEFESGKFSRYDFLDGEEGNVYYNDRFLFSVDTASILTTNREAMWAETNQNFANGTFGNPADPQTLLLYWNIMKGLNYPLAKHAISNLKDRSQQLPQDMQQAIMSNPDIMEGLDKLMKNPDIINQLEQHSEVKENVQNNQQ